MVQYTTTLSWLRWFLSRTAWLWLVLGAMTIVFFGVDARMNPMTELQTLEVSEEQVRLVYALWLFLSSFLGWFLIAQASGRTKLGFKGGCFWALVLFFCFTLYFVGYQQGSCFNGLFFVASFLFAHYSMFYAVSWLVEENGFFSSFLRTFGLWYKAPLPGFFLFIKLGLILGFCYLLNRDTELLYSISIMLVILASFLYSSWFCWRALQKQHLWVLPGDIVERT